MKMEEYTWEELRNILEEDSMATIVIPVGALSQYGLHLPIGTNVMIAYHLALEASKRTKRKTLVAPPIWYGYEYPDDRPGTITVYPEVLSEYVTHILASLVEQGFKRFVLFYSHLPNISPLNAASQKIISKYKNVDLKIAIVSWWQLSGDILYKLFKEETGYHAMSSETSLLMYININLVRQNKIVDEMPKITIGYDLYPKDESMKTKSGVIGKPSIASLEKGRELAETVAERLAQLIDNDLVLVSKWELL